MYLLGMAYPFCQRHKREIHRFDSNVAGTTHRKDKFVFETIKVDDTLVLQREGTNKCDSNAILVLNEEKKKIGYDSEKDNIVFARRMDAGKILKARLIKIMQKGSYKQISVGIYLVAL